MKNKKGAIEGLMAMIVPLIAIGILLAVGFLIMSEAKTQIRDIQGLNSTFESATHPKGTAAINGTNDTINAIADIPGWLPIIVITVIGALLIGLVARFRSR